MFVALEELVRATGKLSLSLRMDGDQMVVIVLPQGDAKEAALRQPLALTSTPAELDAGFVGALQAYSVARKSLDEQVIATTAILQSAEKSQAGKAQKALAKGSKPALPAPVASGTTADAPSEDSDDDEEGGNDNESATPASSVEAAAPAAEQKGSDLFSLL